MASTTLLGSGTRNNGGSIIGAGNVASTSHTKNMSIITSLHKTVYGSFANETNANSGLATRPLSTGNYAKMVKGIFIAKYLNAGTIAGLANTAINTMSRDPNSRTVHKLQSNRRYDNTSWTMQGVLTKGGAAGNSYNMIDPEVAGGTTASAESGSPENNFVANGELVFMAGSKTPSTVSYSLRKG